ncbi:MAG: type II toxin-antitoxin system RelE/ParE family toxin [Burkholderiaceae bacterium]
MTYQVRYTPAANEDLQRLFDFLLQHDLQTARRALVAIRKSMELLENFPFTCRKAQAGNLPDNPFLRELVIAFGSFGYVALFEIENDTLVTVLAVRHQRESDYH